VNLARLFAAFAGPPGVWRFVRIVVLISIAGAVVRLIPLPRWHAAGTRRRRPRSRAAMPAAVAVAAVAVGGCAFAASAHLVPRPAPRPTPQPVLAVGSERPAAAVRPGVGVFVPGATASYRPVDAFMKLTGTRVGLVVYYSAWNDPFQTRFAGWAHARDAVPMVQLEPRGITLASIAAGRSDAYLRHFAAAVTAFRYPVAVSFAPEANGPFYSWGCGHTPAPVYVAAWRHVHAVMTAAGGRNIIWVWDMNRIFHRTCPLSARWPGARYVDWIGVDGYWRGPGSSFATTLAPTIRAARQLARKPVLIGETGAPDVPAAPTWVRSVFDGARATPGVIGVVWFDYGDRLGNYRLEDDPAALAIFRREARHYR
jgi:glycosyl hydrolase family 26